MPLHLIVLDVSGRKFQTQKATLQTSPYFQNLLARWDDCSDRQDDGSYFIDADPDAFQHILNFMRRPSKFLLLWSKETGFDYALYNKIEAEADYFLLHALRDWLQKNRYLDAVKTTIEVKALSEKQLEDDRNQTRYEADIEVQGFFGSYSGEKRYRSLCAIHPINTEPVRGCHSCEGLIQAHGPQYDDPPKRLTLVTKRIEFGETVCVNKTVS
ncbi:hypothetical protein AA0113_g12259 [Alternaria arborescens]|uniref:BTB domain-containing protein n=1 Tax=Alternaria arborescens TaxID=156630 RepID=A0A4V1WXG3_9PLEO|nr:hypothetical protein AA0113_g12259 [Alternaria arborescens]